MCGVPLGESDWVWAVWVWDFWGDGNVLLRIWALVTRMRPLGENSSTGTLLFASCLLACYTALKVDFKKNKAIL